MESLIQDMIQVGIPEELAREQHRLLARGTVYAQLIDSASLGNGILSVENRLEELVELYDSRSDDVKVLKFVPASGAATRMFKDLINEWKDGVRNPGSDSFFGEIKNVAFTQQLDLKASRADILDQILAPEQLDLDNKPKGSIEFHKYGESTRTAFEEHLVEGVDYASSGGKVHIHFTISPEHMDSIKRDMKGWAEQYAENLGCEYDLEFSIQLPFTDTVPFSLDGIPMKDMAGRLKTRPGGHGSLIYNLNELEADVIFIKNIDNVVPDKHRGDTIKYKKALGGLLMSIRKEARAIISQIKAEDSMENRTAAIEFLKGMGTSLDYQPEREELISMMNRPYRVCGMVKNQGEPGGGPFWVKNEKGKSLQIVESAQINSSDPSAVAMLQQGTHFNPVDLVCSLNDLYGMRQDLLSFIDRDSAFVTGKHIDGQEAKVIEWPGLWNGAMADWNTVFVEVPISTFNPVKTVNDLLRPMHQ